MKSLDTTSQRGYCIHLALCGAFPSFVVSVIGISPFFLSLALDSLAFVCWLCGFFTVYHEFLAFIMNQVRAFFLTYRKRLPFFLACFDLYRRWHHGHCMCRRISGSCSLCSSMEWLYLRYILAYSCTLRPRGMTIFDSKGQKRSPA